MENYIQLKQNDILKLGIRDENGKDTGNVLEFDLEDIELLPRYQELVEKDKKNRSYLYNQLKILDKKQDYKKKNEILTYKEKETLKYMQDFYKKEVEIYNLFLGKDGVQKLLNGRNLNWSTLEEIDTIINESILPNLKLTEQNIREKIMKKYSKKEDDVLE